MLQTAAFAANLILAMCEFYTLKQLKNKRDILKYYTYLQNFLALISSLVFCVCCAAAIAGGQAVPEWVKGLRYVATTGLVSAMVIFVLFLGGGKHIAMTEDDFLNRFSPGTANLLLHYVCPLLSVVSFLVLERGIRLSSGIWTGIVAVPSCLYWIVYLLLSLTNAWEEPYHFGEKEGDGRFSGYLPFLLMPLFFVGISFLLWNIM